jgi:hypothetical protein
MLLHYIMRSQDSMVNIMMRQEARCSKVGILARVINLSLLHGLQTGSRAHPASYSMGTNGSFPRGKEAGAYSSRFIYILCQG